MIGALCGVWVRRLRGPALIDPQQEEVWRLRHPNLHVHLRPGLPSRLKTKNTHHAAFCRGTETWTHFASEFDGGSAVVRLGIGVVGVQHHLYRCVEVVHAHHRLAGHDHRGDNWNYVYSALS